MGAKANLSVKPDRLQAALAGALRAPAAGYLKRYVSSPQRSKSCKRHS